MPHAAFSRWRLPNSAPDRITRASVPLKGVFRNSATEWENLIDEQSETCRRRRNDSNCELDVLQGGRVLIGIINPVARENTVKVERERIEYERGMDYLERTRRERKEP